MFAKIIEKVNLHRLVVFVLTILCFVIHFLTPLHSDDFLFEMLGLTFEKQWIQYDNWGGRVVANYSAAFILFLKNKYLIAFAQTLATMGLIYFISQLPAKASNKKAVHFLSFIFISCLYWLYHPSLGHSTFWITGAANYVWTNVFICAYLGLLLHYFYNNKFSYLAVIVALLAGCSNENTAPVIVAFTFLLLINKSLVDRKPDWKLLILFLSNLGGALILLLARGNEVRLNFIKEIPGFEWKDLTIEDKFNKFESQYWEFLLVPFLLLMFLYVVLFFLKGIKIFTENKKITFFTISVLFVLASYASEFVMFLSPLYPRRAMTGSFIFLLIAISFVFFQIFELSKERKIVQNLKYVLVVITLAMFAELYINQIFPFYRSAYNQNQVQLTLIEKYKSQGEKNVRIPKTYMSRQYDSRILIDDYVDQINYAKYYGFDSVELYNPEKDIFEFGEKQLIAQNLKMLTNGGIKQIDLAKNSDNALFVFEFSEDEIKTIQPNHRMFFHVIDKKNKIHNFDIGEIKPELVEGKLIISYIADIKSKKIHKISFGYFDVNDWNERIVEYDISIK